MNTTAMKKKRMVMLIDDNSIDNFVNKKMILYYRFADSVQEFLSPVKALEHLRKVDSAPEKLELIPELILLDMNMPVMSGEEFLKQFEELSSALRERCKVVILSGVLNGGELYGCQHNKQVMAIMQKPLIKMNLDYLENLLAKEASRSIFSLLRS
jgi:CheY-like chemotaxis protein